VAATLTAPLSEVARLFASLAFLAIGGVNAVVPEMERQVVGVHGWMSADRFAELFALAQAAPGPNFLVATLVGFRVAGVAGASVATLALIGPTCVLTYAVSAAWHRFRAARWRQVVQAGLTPVTVGLVLSAAVLLSIGAATSLSKAMLIVASLAATLSGRLHPLLLLGAGAVIGIALGAVGVP
jgi:chromate transporter